MRNSQIPNPKSQILSTKSGATLVELLLFLAFFALSSGVLLAFFFMTSEQRVRQQTISTVEQTGLQLMQTIGNRVRNAERILYPVATQTGSVLVVQLADSSLHPTVLGISGSYLYVGEANNLRALSSDDVTIEHIIFQNTSVADDRATVHMQFDVTRSVPLSIPLNYTRTFETLLELFPDNQTSVACSCDAPTCSAGSLTWEYCEDAVCTASNLSLSCN